MPNPIRAALWPHQQEAVDALAAAFEKSERATAILACGTGKTRISAATVQVLAARSGVSRVLVVVPFLELITQTLREWRMVIGDAGMGRVVAVCSDKDVLREQPHLHAERASVTTRAEDLARLTQGPGVVTVAVTYASLPVIAAAHDQHGLPMWDLIILDEAHRSAGQADKTSAMVHSNVFIPAARRQYMTATPRIVAGGRDDAISMDDPKVYGDVAYRLGFQRAIELGLLANYRIIVPVVTDDQVRAAAETSDGDFYQSGRSAVSPAVLATQIAILRAAHEYGLRRMITFHNRVLTARWFATTLPHAAAHLAAHERPADLSVGHVHGSESLAARQRTLARLKATDDSLVVITNARVLGEGIDVPAIDSVAFVDNRGSAIDCIQAVGRALRRGKQSGPKTASVIVPVLLKPGEDPEEALSTSRFAPVWQVVRALGAHDDGLSQRLAQMRQDLGVRPRLSGCGIPGAGSGGERDHLELPDWLRITGVPVPPAFASAITVRTVRSSTQSWEEYYGAALAFGKAHGHTRIPADHVTAAGLRLGAWWTKQRVAHNAGELPDARRRLLERAGMVWDQGDASWTATYEVVKRLAAEQGHFAFDASVTTPHGLVIASWCRAQRARRRQGKLAEQRIELLDAIGFPWDGAQDRWMRRYRELKAVYDQRKSLLRLPSGGREAVWLENQRIAHRHGRLAPWQLELMNQVGIDFSDRRNAVWNHTYKVLKAFQAEHGHCTVPGDLVTADGVNVRSWATSQRSRHRAGDLPAEHKKLLDALGFSWDPAADRWNSRCRELAQFQAEYGHLNVPPGQLHSWLYQQRKKHRLGKLSKNAQQRLSEIDPLWHQTDRQ
ncbi:Helicase associated domain protein [Streptomyces sp. NPDC046275]|uniref:DEAD/DEAH box helicase n=1 Tax=Streptomyces sp. NPDC046275 TaxID=3157201 RepID=UPI0033D4786D